MSNRGYSPDCHSVLRAHARVLLYMTDDKKKAFKELVTSTLGPTPQAMPLGKIPAHMLSLLL